MISTQDHCNVSPDTGWGLLLYQVLCGAHLVLLYSNHENNSGYLSSNNAAAIIKAFFIVSRPQPRRPVAASDQRDMDVH